METVGGLLRRWRHGRRLSQLDLAIAADVSARYVSLVETGKSRPSAGMVLRLASHLDVPLRDRNRLLVAAGFAPRYRERPLDGPDMTAAREAVARILRAHEPYPALVVDGHWNILMHNAPVAFFFAEADPALLGPPANMIRLSLSPHGLGDRIVNFAEVRALFGARLARQAAATGDPVLAALHEEFFPGPEPATSPPGPETEVATPMVFDFRGREVRLFSTITTFGTARDITLDEISIESYYPADPGSAAALRDIAAEYTGDLKAPRTALSGNRPS
ncbi:MAG TPA: helix-turn-helix transcriptional regulator [Phytomonospora sp.]